MYKIRKILGTDIIEFVEKISYGVLIPFDPANTDYQQVKADILAGKELQDADGNTLSQTEAEAFIATLP